MSPIRKQQGTIPNHPVPEWRVAEDSDASATNGSPTSTRHTFSGNNFTCIATAAALPVSDLPLIKQHGHTLQSQQQKEKNIVKSPVERDRDKLFNTIYTSHLVQPSWGTGPIAHPWIVPLPCYSTIDYNHHHLRQLLCNQAASEDVGKICPPTDNVSMMVPLPTSESQEAFSILLDDNNDENQNGLDMQAPECQICFNGRVQLIFIPCGHGTCQSCSNQLVMQHCPFCRQMVSHVVEIHY